MKASAALIGLLLPLAAYADEAVRQRAEQVVRESFAAATPQEWAARMQQDDVQALCSRYRNQPPPTIAEQIAASQRQAIRYPSDGKLMGDWKNGEALARIGGGGHIGKIQPDPPGARRGGNCYACHRLAADEVAAGTIGPSLTGYAQAARDVAGIDPVRVREDLQRAGLLPVLVDAALRPQQLADARGDRRPRGVSAGSGARR